MDDLNHLVLLVEEQPREAVQLHRDWPAPPTREWVAVGDHLGLTLFEKGLTALARKHLARVRRRSPEIGAGSEFHHAVHELSTLEAPDATLGELATALRQRDRVLAADIAKRRSMDRLPEQFRQRPALSSILPLPGRQRWSATSLANVFPLVLAWFLIRYLVRAACTTAPPPPPEKANLPLLAAAPSARPRFAPLGDDLARVPNAPRLAALAKQLATADDCPAAVSVRRDLHAYLAKPETFPVPPAITATIDAITAACGDGL